MGLSRRSQASTTTTPSMRASTVTPASRGPTRSRTLAAIMGTDPRLGIEAEALRPAPLPQGTLKDRQPSHHTIEVFAVAPTSSKAAETHPSVITQTHHQSNKIITCN